VRRDGRTCSQQSAVAILPRVAMASASQSTSARKDGGEENVLLPRRSDGTPLKCLVVEDEDFIAHLLAERLEDWGAETQIAPTLAAALRLLTDMRPDLVLLDVRLPDGDGVELATRMRDHSEPAIVFVTGDSDPKTLRRIRSLGDYPVVPKPFDFRQLRLAIQQALARRASPRP
jgi:DNA-binding response OmpR family regulator